MTTSQIAYRPEEAGVASDTLEAVFARVKRDVDAGLAPSAQVAVARHGRLAGFRTFGTAVQDGRRQPATNDTLYCIFSCTKAVVAAGVWSLFEDGKLALDEPVAAILPAFGQHGKAAITVEQVLLHVSGFPRSALDPLVWSDPAARDRAFGSWPLEWEPGSRFEYHAVSAHWVLAAIIEARAGVPFQRFLRERILDRLGLDNLHVGLPAELNRRVAEIEYVAPPVEPPGGWGVVSPEFVLGFNDPAIRAVGVPGAGGFGTAAGLALFYQSLIQGGATPDGGNVLSPETIAWATRVRTTDRHRDPLQDIPVNRALSVVVAGDDGAAHMRGFGRGTSPVAFGHGGAGGQIAWGDPVTGISVGYCTNGFVDALTSGRRMTAIGSLAAACALPDGTI
jgi:CubicO group peptidase (beta-lactamase class C family)